MHSIVCAIVVSTAQITDIPEPGHLLRVAVFLMPVQNRVHYVAVRSLAVPSTSLNVKPFLLLIHTYCHTRSKR
jgi:hypothetical protein